MKRLQLACIAACLAPTALAQNTWYVDDDGNPPGTGTMYDPYTSIAWAAAQASTAPGDTILVLEGTYYEAINLLGKELTIASVTPGGATIDARNLPGYPPAVLAQSVGPGAVVLNGFRILGNGGIVIDHQQGYRAGGGVFGQQSSLSITKCSFVGCTSDLGGGVFLDSGDLELLDCEFTDCYASDGAGVCLYSSVGNVSYCLFRGTEGHYDHAYRGGGIYSFNSDLTVTQSTFWGETAYAHGSAIFTDGGSLRLDSCHAVDNYVFDYGGTVTIWSGSAEIFDCQFLDNRSSFGWGSGVFMREGSLQADNSDFAEGYAAEGGAVSVWSGQANFLNCRFTANISSAWAYWESGNGGAIFARPEAAVVLRDCALFGNASHGQSSNGSPGCGGAIYGPVEVYDSTIYGNSAFSPDGTQGASGGLCGGSLHNCIAWGNFPYSLEATDEAIFSNVQGGWPGEGNIDADPLFVNAPDDLHLVHGSPCIDAGDPEAPLDPDGTRADMGAYPYMWASIGTNYCVANAHSGGLEASIDATGSAMVADNWLRLTGADLPQDQYGYFLMSDKPAFIPFFGGSEGNLCLGPPQIRFNTPPPQGAVLFSGPEGKVEFRPDLTNLPQQTVFLPGETWNFQLWFRDVVAGNFTSNTTDGTTVIWQ